MNSHRHQRQHAIFIAIAYLLLSTVAIAVACYLPARFDSNPEDVINNIAGGQESQQAIFSLTETQSSIFSGTKSPSSTPVPSMTPSPTLTVTLTATPTGTPAILVGAGDISICGQDGDDFTAAILDDIPGIIFTAGDNTNEDGARYEYQNCFDPSWGRHLSRIRPSAGNHDYYSDNGENYYDYFGTRAGEPGKGYYSYSYGDWHIIVLNSNCGYIGGCGPSSPQIKWLEEDLENHAGHCVLAYWHHPRFTSGFSGGSEWLDAFWQTLYRHRVDVVVNGHDHHYERFAPQNPLGDLDPDQGIRQFIVGTGGAGLRNINPLAPNSEIRITHVYGVLKFTLFSDYYTWEFISVEGEASTDAGKEFCH